MEWLLIVVIAMVLVGTVTGLFTRGGSGVNEHPQDASGEPGSSGGGERSGRDEGEGSTLGTHGTK